MKIISFGHEKNVGKDTFARLVIQELRLKNRGINIIKAGFADKLKKVCFDLYSWTGLKSTEYYEDNPIMKEKVIPELGCSPRELWLKLAIKMREYDDSIFLNALIKNCKADFLFIKDMRFPVEANFILNNGGMVFKIIRPSVAHSSDSADDPLLTFDKWTDIIYNESGLLEFHEKVQQFVEKYF